MQHRDGDDPIPGEAETLAPGLRRLLCDNPSPMTFRGTNTYLLGDSEIAVVDPGPDVPAHLQAILAAVRPGQRITHIVVTHAHLDHSPLARPLAAATDAPVYAFGDAQAGRSAVMQRLAQSGHGGGGEGVDRAFRPDRTLADGEVISGSGWSLEALHTPGHMGNHLCLAWGRACFTADHVMGWASSLVSPPDGDLTDFMASCARLAARDWEVFYPGHGAPVTDPNGRLRWLIEHRQGRSAQILDALADGPATAQDLAERIYQQTPAPLIAAATRNVFAHLIDLAGRAEVDPLGPLAPDTAFKRR